MTSSLTDRNLQVVVGGATSQPFPIFAGVPPGSILGPTLFLLYVNDAADVLPDGVSPATYADDTTLYSTICPHWRQLQPPAKRSRRESTSWHNINGEPLEEFSLCHLSLRQ